MLLVLISRNTIAGASGDQDKFKFIAENTICQQKENVVVCHHKEDLTLKTSIGDLPIAISMMKVKNNQDNPISMVVMLDKAHQNYWVTDCFFFTEVDKKPIQLKNKIIKGLQHKEQQLPVFDKADLKKLVDSNEIFIVLHLKNLNSKSPENKYITVSERLNLNEQNNLKILILRMLAIL